MQFETANGVLIARNGGEMLRIEPWGKNSLRVRATMLPELSNQDWALTETPESSHAEVECHEVDHWVGDGTIDKKEIASITNGRIKAVVNLSLPLSQMDAYAQLLTLQVLSHFTVTADSFYASIIAATMAH